jgi:hypothetical protein
VTNTTVGICSYVQVFLQKYRKIGTYTTVGICSYVQVFYEKYRKIVTYTTVGMCRYLQVCVHISGKYLHIPTPWVNIPLIQPWIPANSDRYFM